VETVNDTDLSSAQLNENIGSPVFDITLVDEFERDIPFSGDIELCLPSLSEDIDVKVGVGWGRDEGRSLTRVGLSDDLFRVL